jgi:hypothetical protein
MNAITRMAPVEDPVLSGNTWDRATGPPRRFFISTGPSFAEKPGLTAPVSEYLLYSFGINFRRDGKHSIFMKTAIGYQDMQVGMKPKHIPEGLYGDNPAGDRLWVTRTSFVKSFQSPPPTATQFRQQFAVVKKIPP